MNKLFKNATNNILNYALNSISMSKTQLFANNYLKNNVPRIRIR